MEGWSLNNNIFNHILLIGPYFISYNENLIVEPYILIIKLEFHSNIMDRDTISSMIYMRRDSEARIDTISRHHIQLCIN